MSAVMAVCLAASIAGGIYCFIAARSWRQSFCALAMQRLDDMDECACTYKAMRAELERLRCGDLVLFVDGELDPARAEAFRVHLATCETCQRDLESHMQLDARLSELAASREPRGGDRG